ncbi:MotA/TolQ/ExbB proton channel family protein [Vibrio genomosp. F6]|uniref:MotA/TolQ/ExbB proton channel family protein n=1 Tax=Vibrio genomosp. F6 TaxID=723172 RepID=UPI0010BD945D|nr:MotA/TolQ/ExbB proton channel family protein [Vibrio genomosp. F6]TKF13146.1 MotA/TolQ/ExbB proton channel family protein [Vibrio genomosp. F6]
MVQQLIKSIYLSVVFLIIGKFISLGEILQFVDVASFLFVVIPTLISFILGHNSSKKIALRNVLYVSTCSGLLGAIIGLIHTLSNFAVDAIGIQVGISVALIPLFYGVSITLLFIPFYSLENN